MNSLWPHIRHRTLSPIGATGAPHLPQYFTAFRCIELYVSKVSTTLVTLSLTDARKADDTGMG